MCYLTRFSFAISDMLYYLKVKFCLELKIEANLLTFGMNNLANLESVSHKFLAHMILAVHLEN